MTRLWMLAPIFSMVQANPLKILTKAMDQLLSNVLLVKFVMSSKWRSSFRFFFLLFGYNVEL
jgi:hypothetical protein